MRHLGAWSIHGLPNTTRHTDYRRLISCGCHAQGDGKLSPEHMPELREDEVLIRMLFARASATGKVFLVETPEDIVTANAERDQAGADSAQPWYAAKTTTVEADFDVTL